MKRLYLSLSVLAAMCASLCHALISEGGRNTYDLDDGLSNGYVTSMAEDSRGGIWVATESGLNRFDGKRFINYTKENSGLPANELNAVAQDPDNPDLVWVATQRNGLAIFSLDEMKFKEPPHKDLWMSGVVSIKAAPNGGMWITDYLTGASFYNSATQELRKYNNTTVAGLPNKCYTAIESQDGTLYVGHVTEGLSAVDTTHHTFVNYRMEDSPLPGDCIHDLMMAGNGYIWIGTDNGAALLNPWTKKITPFINNIRNNNSISAGAIRRIIELKDGSILFATTRGGTCMLPAGSFNYDNPENATFKTVTANSSTGSMECMNIHSVLEDRYGNVWIGQYRAGVNVITHVKPMFSRIEYVRSSQSGTVHPSVWGCMADTNGIIWAGADGEVAKIDRNVKTYQMPGMNEENKTAVTSIIEEDDKNLIIGTVDQGAFRLNKDSGVFTEIDGLPANVRSIHKDTARGILFCTNDSIWALNSNRGIRLNVNGIMSDHVIQCIERDAGGNLWVGTFGGGLNILSPTLYMKAVICEKNGFASNAVNDILKDSKGRMWVATRNGLVLFDRPTNPTKFRLIINPDDSGFSHIMAVAEDKDGNIWASSDNGVAFVDTKTFGVTFHHTDNETPLNTFSERGATIDKNGKVFLTSANGLISIDTRNNSIAGKEIPVVLSNFTTYKEGDNRKENEVQMRVTDGKVNLTHDQSMFRITFAIPDQGIMKYSTFAYKMVGYDDSWVELHNENSVAFRNLPPGHYKFLVRFRFKGNEWSTPEQIVDIRIAPPIWLSWWALTIYAILAVGIIGFIFYLYVRRVKLKERLTAEMAQNNERQMLNEERLRFFTNITHELRTPLTLILGPIEDMVSDPSLPQKYNFKLRMIRESSKSLLSLINGILEFRKTETQNRQLSVEKGDISNLVYEIGLRYKELNMNKNVEFTIDIDKDLKEIYFDREMMSMMLNNILSNAVKYTKRGSITLTLRQIIKDGEGRTETSVADTGFGMKKEEIEKIFKRYYQVNGEHQASGTGIGLALVKNLAELHEADITVDSEEGRGSTFTISLKTENIYPDAIHTERKVHPAHIPANESPDNDQDNEKKKYKILVVEDNDEIREYVKQSLATDYDVVTATNGLEGLKAVHDENPDIVVSDIMMPEMDGIQLCSAIKEDILTCHIPVILLTAKDSLDDREAGYESGADSYLTKPFSTSLLRGRISNLMQQKERLARTLVKEAIQNQETKNETEEANQPDQGIHLSPLDRRFIDEIKKHVTENLSDPALDVQFIADKMCMSYSTLYRKSKSILGISMLEYIRGIRLARAKEMIEEGELTITEIAYAVGYGGHSSFGKIFRKEFGMSASEYAAKFHK